MCLNQALRPMVASCLLCLQCINSKNKSNCWQLVLASTVILVHMVRRFLSFYPGQNKWHFLSSLFITLRLRCLSCPIWTRCLSCPGWIGALVYGNFQCTYVVFWSFVPYPWDIHGITSYVAYIYCYSILCDVFCGCCVLALHEHPIMWLVSLIWVSPSCGCLWLCSCTIYWQASVWLLCSCLSPHLHHMTLQMPAWHPAGCLLTSGPAATSG